MGGEGNSGSHEAFTANQTAITASVICRLKVEEIVRSSAGRTKIFNKRLEISKVGSVQQEFITKQVNLVKGAERRAAKAGQFTYF